MRLTTASGRFAGGFPIVLHCSIVEALEVHLEITTNVPKMAEVGSFETHHSHLGGGRISATVAQNCDIVSLHCYLVVN